VTPSRVDSLPFVLSITTNCLATDIGITLIQSAFVLIVPSVATGVLTVITTGASYSSSTDAVMCPLTYSLRNTDGSLFIDPNYVFDENTG